MKRSRRSSRRQQLNLFQLPPRRMTWAMLPTEVQEEVKRLLVRMFGQKLCRAAQRPANQGVTHER